MAIWQLQELRRDNDRETRTFDCGAPMAAPRKCRSPSRPTWRLANSRRASMNKDRMSVLAAMMDQGVIPVFYHPDVEVCIKVIQACANGGAKCIEFTNRGDFAAHVFLEVDAPFRQGRSQRDHGRGLDRRCADRGHLHRQRRQVRRRPDPQRRCRQGLQPPQHSLQPRLRLGHARSPTRRNSAARSSRCSRVVRSADPSS